MKKKTILLIDDEEKIRQSISKILENKFKVLTAPNGKEALTYIGKYIIDCIILDLEMPYMSGVEFLNKLRTNGNITPVVIITGKSCQSYAEQCAHLGVQGFFIKPFDIGKLEGRLNRIAASKKVGDPNTQVLQKDLPPKVLRAISYVHREYHRRINRNYLIESLGISSKHLNTLFKTHLGTTFSDYVSWYRTEKAKEHLTYPDLSISDISNKVGLNNSQSLLRYFKKYVGQTPLQYRDKVVSKKQTISSR